MRVLYGILICLIKVQGLQVFRDVFCSLWCDKPGDTIIDTEGCDRDLQSCDWQVECGQASAVCCLFQYKSKVSRNGTSRSQVENKGRWSATYQVADLQNSPKGVVGTKNLHRLQGRLSRY